MYKFFKIFIVLIIFMLLCVPLVYASDIDMNLSTGDDSTQTSNNQMQNEVNSTTNEVQNNVDDQTNNVPITNSNFDTLQPTDVDTVEESGLGVTNIINILVITVGVILILLAIAIIIRLK